MDQCLKCFLVLSLLWLSACNGTVTDGPSQSNPPERGPRVQPGTAMGIYAPEQHDLYDGRFIISGSRIYQVGTLNDESPWDHMGNDGSNLRPVEGTVDFDVDEINNTGTFRADLQLPEGRYVIDLEEFKEFSPCQDGGIASWLFEHGDSGCGDANWPKSILYVAGWGIGSATLNGEPLYQDYQIHFMVTQGMRDRNLVVFNFPLRGRVPRPAPSSRPSSNWTSTSGVPRPTRPIIPSGRCSTTSSPWRSPGNNAAGCSASGR